MTDTNNIEVLRAVRSVFDHIPQPCAERDALDAAITALSARASAGEGGEWVMVPRSAVAPADEDEIDRHLREVRSSPEYRQEMAGLDASIIRSTDAMVSRFLAWPLPATVCADHCASDPTRPHRSGTNLLSAVEARAMLEYVLTAAPQPAQAGASGGGDVAELVAAAEGLLEEDSVWDDDLEEEVSESAKARNKHVRAYQRLKSAVARFTTPTSPATGEDDESDVDAGPGNAYRSEVV